MILIFSFIANKDTGFYTKLQNNYMARKFLHVVYLFALSVRAIFSNLYSE